MKQIDFAGGGTAYLAPELEIVDVATEQGFATSETGIYTTDYGKPTVDDFTYTEVEW